MIIVVENNLVKLTRLLESFDKGYHVVRDAVFTKRLIIEFVINSAVSKDVELFSLIKTTNIFEYYIKHIGTTTAPDMPKLKEVAGFTSSIKGIFSINKL